MNLVHAKFETEYDETTHVYHQRKPRQTTVYLGRLPDELPYLLRRALPGEATIVAGELEGADPGTFDYVVEGRVLQTRQTVHQSVALGIVSLVGIPSMFTRHEMEVEVSVFATQAPHVPIFSRVYRVDDRRAVGLYYNWSSRSDLAMAALTTVVSEASKDVVKEITLHQARQSMAVLQPPSGAPA
ncbi:MAG: hypothetical protein KUG77_05610 [Nannocystaceae bacterium]|nr:hypothetical protein [Nannocystaceae bacterium]